MSSARSSAPVDWRRAPDLELTPILSSALDAFHENGYHGTTVRDIARRVGLTVPAIYYHHENKEAVLVELFDRSNQAVLALCREALADAGDDPGKRFFNLVECLVLFMAHSTKIASIDRETRSLTPKHRAVYSAKRREVERLVVDAIADGVRAGIFEVTDAAVSGRALIGMIQAIATWFQPGGRQSAQSIADSYVDVSAHLVGHLPAGVRTGPRHPDK